MGWSGAGSWAATGTPGPASSREPGPRKTVLVSGGAGYIGAMLVRLLLEDGLRVRVLDCLRFGGDSLLDLL